MSLVTRCPTCNTLFRVAAAQLQARAGKVRCGRCMNVFDGFAGLAGEQPQSGSEPVRTDAASSSSAQIAERTTAPNTGVSAAPRVAPATASSTGIAAPSPSSSAPDAPAPSAPTGQSASGAQEFAATHVLGRLRERVLRKPAPHGAHIAACALLILLLLAQAAYSFRSQLAARSPIARALLGGVCNVTGCAVSLPQRPDLVKIEASDVHMLDANRPGLIQLTATLRSYATYDLAHPALDLVLTNANEHALARRIFVPEEYLDSSRDPSLGIPPRAEITVALDLDTGDLNAAGFRLDLIAAP